jgi:hypothetical protein
MVDERTWPTDVLDYLETHRQVFLAWELRHIGRENIKVNVAEFERASLGLRTALNPHTLHGYHCTRLTQPEIDAIILHGMHPSSATMLRSRIAALLDAGLITALIAKRLSSENQANAIFRSGMIWFCFYPPRNVTQQGVERFFRCWGGEALYNLHERNPRVAPILNRIGVPCLVEADVPIASLEIHSYLDSKVARRFLVKRGLKTIESIDHEDRAKQPIPAGNIRRIIRFPERDFIRLTRCDKWTPPL